MTDASAQPPKQYVVERVRNVLAQHPRVGELDIHVKVLGNRVFVRGTVPTVERCAAITDVLEETLPDFDIENEVSVVEPVERTGEEQLS